MMLTFSFLFIVSLVVALDFLVTILCRTYRKRLYLCFLEFVRIITLAVILLRSLDSFYALTASDLIGFLILSFLGPFFIALSYILLAVYYLFIIIQGFAYEFLYCLLFLLISCVCFAYRIKFRFVLAQREIMKILWIYTFFWIDILCLASHNWEIPKMLNF